MVVLKNLSGVTGHNDLSFHSGTLLTSMDKLKAALNIKTVSQEGLGLMFSRALDTIPAMAKLMATYGVRGFADIKRTEYQAWRDSNIVSLKRVHRCGMDKFVDLDAHIPTGSTMTPPSMLNVVDKLYAEISAYETLNTIDWYLKGVHVDIKRNRPITATICIPEDNSYGSMKELMSVLKGKKVASEDQLNKAALETVDTGMKYISIADGIVKYDTTDYRTVITSKFPKAFESISQFKDYGEQMYKMSGCLRDVPSILKLVKSIEHTVDGIGMRMNREDYSADVISKISRVVQVAAVVASRHATNSTVHLMLEHNLVITSQAATTILG